MACSGCPKCEPRIPVTDRELREWNKLPLPLAAPGPETLTTVYRAAFPALLDEVAELRAERARSDEQTSAMVDRIRLYCSQGTGLPIESIGGMEGAVVNLAVEARTMRRERDEARSEIERLLNEG